jgi:hypothetical protein
MRHTVLGFYLKLMPSTLPVTASLGLFRHYLCIWASLCAGILLGKASILLRMKTVGLQVIHFP